MNTFQFEPQLGLIADLLGRQISDHENSVLCGIIKSIPIIFDFMEQNFPSYSQQLFSENNPKIQFCSRLVVRTLRSQSVIYIKGQPNNDLSFLIQGQAILFYDKEQARFSQTYNKGQINSAVFTQLKTRLASLRTTEIDDKAKKDFGKKFGHFSKFVDQGSIIEERSQFNQNFKTFNAVASTDVFLISIDRDHYFEFLSTHESEMKLKKKFLIDIFRDSITSYDKSQLNYQIYNMKVYNDYLMIRKRSLNEGKFFMFRDKFKIGEVKLLLKDVTKYDKQIDIQVCLLGPGQFLNEECLSQVESEFTAVTVSLKITVLELKRELFSKFPQHCKQVMMESLKNKRSRRNQMIQEFDHFEWKQSMVNVINGAHKQYLQTRKNNILGSQDPFNENKINLEKYISVDANSNKELMNHFRMQVQSTKTKKEGFQTVESLLSVIDDFQTKHKTEQDNKHISNHLLDKFDFGNGDIEKQEKQEHYFKVAKQQLKRIQSYPQQDNYLRQFVSRVGIHLQRMNKQSQKCLKSIEIISCNQLLPLSQIQVKNIKALSSLGTSQEIKHPKFITEIRSTTPLTTNYSIMKSATLKDSTRKNKRMSIELLQNLGSQNSDAQRVTMSQMSQTVKDKSSTADMLNQRHRAQMKLKQSLTQMSNIQKQI